MLTMPLLAVLWLILVAVVLWLINGYIPIPAGKIKTVVNVVLGLIVVGIALWLINAYVPMAGVIKAILNVVVVIATCVGVLQAFGLWGSVENSWRKLRNHRWTHPEPDQQPLSQQKPATEKPVTEQKLVTENVSSERPVTARVSIERPANGAPAEQNRGEKSAEKKESQEDPAVTVIVK